MAVLDQDAARSSSLIAYDFLVSAMQNYEDAAAIRPPGNDDALLRWNTCVRMMNSHGVQRRRR